MICHCLYFYIFYYSYCYILLLLFLLLLLFMMHIYCTILLSLNLRRSEKPVKVGAKSGFAKLSFHALPEERAREDVEPGRKARAGSRWKP